MTEQTGSGSGVRPWAGAGWVVVMAGLGVNLVLGVLYAWTMMGRGCQHSIPMWTRHILMRGTGRRRRRTRRLRWGRRRLRSP